MRWNLDRLVNKNAGFQTMLASYLGDIKTKLSLVLNSLAISSVVLFE